MSRREKSGAGRRLRHSTDAFSAVSPVWPGMTGGRYLPLDPTALERIHELALRLLEELGLSQITDSLGRRAIAAGCSLGSDGRLRFPRALVENVIARSRRRFSLYGFDPAHDIEIGGGRVHMGSGGAAPFIMDFAKGHYRDSTVADLYDITRLVDRLENIHFYHRSVVARDTSSAFDLDINTIYTCLQATTKPVAVSFTDSASVHAAIPLLDRIAGGAGRFRERPFCTLVCCHVVPPMRFAEESCDAMEAAIEAGMPVLLIAAGQAGATAPVTLASAVAQACAESLAGLVLCNIVDPECRAIFAPWPFVSDLRTGSMSGGSGEQSLLSAASAQMARFYDLPSSVPAGMTDAKLPDIQAGWEKGYSTTLAAHAGASMIHESVGMHGSLMGTSLESYVLDNEMLGAVLRTVSGVEVSDDTLDYDVIRDVVLGDGHYLGHAQTLARMKSDYLYPEIADRRSIDDWQQSGGEDLRNAARNKVQKILAEHYPEHIPTDVDDWIRKNYNIVLATERMRRGNGFW